MVKLFYSAHLWLTLNFQLVILGEVETLNSFFKNQKLHSPIHRPAFFGVIGCKGFCFTMMEVVKVLNAVTLLQHD
ncbi:MAG TPA: hypothetical protein VI757_12560 [Bacteroidia bacterium]|nr:hypothetical protein [Bacteroidia bacterium]